VDGRRRRIEGRSWRRRRRRRRKTQGGRFESSEAGDGEEVAWRGIGGG